MVPMMTSYPPPIFSSVPGTWSHSTVTVRFPEIAQRVIVENQFSDTITDQIKILQAEILSGSIRHLEDQGAPDQGAWRRYIEPFRDKNWLEVPWFFAEHYFYRRIMEALSYFDTYADPFWYQKEQGLIQNDQEIREYISNLRERISPSAERDQALRASLYFSLWGNQADLSLWPAGSDITPRHSSQNILNEHLLDDQSSQVIGELNRTDGKISRVDMMLDNAGFELVCDLGLADTLLSRAYASSIVLHVKAHPTFVSDVIPNDLDRTLDFLLGSGSDDVAAFGRRIKDYLAIGKLQVRKDFFWNSPLAMWDLPLILDEELQKASLVISKGDANYRRILGDREWEITTPFQQALDYIGAPLAALRTLKAELAVGLDQDQVQRVSAQDPGWMVNGRWGLIQYASGRGERSKE